MKPTPRTDALYARLPKGLTAVSEATWVCNQYLDHACTLERELAEAVELLREDFAAEEGPGETDRPYYIKLRAFLQRMGEK